MSVRLFDISVSSSQTVFEIKSQSQILKQGFWHLAKSQIDPILYPSSFITSFDYNYMDFL